MSTVEHGPGAGHDDGRPAGSKPGPGRRAALGLGLGLPLAAGASWAAGRAVGSEGRPSKDLRIGYLPITDAAPLLVGHARNFYADEGLSVRKPILFRSWSSLSEAFVSGELDVIHLLMPMALYMKFGLGTDARITAWNHVNGSALTVEPEIDGLHDLAGRTVAIPAWWSVHNVILQDMLRAEGLTPVMRRSASAGKKEVQLVVMAPADMIPALANGTIAGFAVADPFNAVAWARKVGKTLRYLGDVWKDHACCVTVMRGELVDRDRQTAQRFMNGLVKAQSWTREHRKEAAGLLAEHYLPQPKKAIQRALTDHAHDFPGAVRHPSWGGQLIDFQPYPYASFTQKLVEAMRGTLVDAPADFLQGLDPATAHRELVDDALVESAVRAAGGPGVFGQTSHRRTEEIQP